MQNIPIHEQRSLFVSIMGAPNSGKSTLTNSMVGEAITIATPKEQTTRTQIRGIAMRGPVQIVMVDTPGIFDAKRPLEKKIVEAAWKVLDKVEHHWLVVDVVRGVIPEVSLILEGLRRQHRPVSLLLNKIDAAPKARTEEVSEALLSAYDFSDCYRISARDPESLDALWDHAMTMAPLFPWPYDPEDLTTSPVRFLAAEYTREQIFRLLHQELPYATAVIPESWEEKDDGSVAIRQAIYVQKHGQKAMVIGQDGRMIREIGQRARARISKLLGCPVHLVLHVAVKPFWYKDNTHIGPNLA